MFSLRIGRMYKRLNSTKSTFSTIHTATNVKLKEHTSVTKPVFLLKNTNADGSTYYYDKADVNYLYWPGYGYYWIDDIVYITNDLIEIYCHRDALATGKPYIEKTKAYVKYCADPSKVSGHHVIDDERFGPDLYLSSNYDTLLTHDIGQGQSLMEDFSILSTNDEGAVMLTVVGNGTKPYTLILSVDKYFDIVRAYLSGAGITTEDRLAEAFMGIDWKSCILSAIYVPLKKSALDNQYSGNTMQTLYIGGIFLDLHETVHFSSLAIPITRSYLRSVTFPDIAKKDGYTWLKGPKYTSLSYVYPGGSLDLSNEALTDFSLLYIEEALNPFTGEHVMKFFTTDTNKNKQIFLGAARDSMAFDLTSVTAAAISGEKTAINFLKNYTNAVVGVASAAIGIQTAVANIGKDKIPDAISNAQDITTGISGIFPNSGIQPITKNVEMNSTYTSYLSVDLDHNFDLHRYRLVASTCIPAAFVDEPTGSQAPTSSVKYDEFAQLFGWPLYQVISLEGVEGYVECVGADIGKVDASEYEDITYRLHPSEISEINSHLNSGLYLE